MNNKRPKVPKLFKKMKPKKKLSLKIDEINEN